MAKVKSCELLKNAWPLLKNAWLSCLPNNPRESCLISTQKGFKQTMMLKKLSALMSPSGQEAIIPVAAFACEACGHINKEFQEADIQKA